jgi:predicted N-formylglutamate amidohydrolase
LPPQYGSLGLAGEAFARHIAYDIGAAGVTRRLAALLDCPAVLTTFSRLLIDPNRGADDPTLIMRISDGAIVPGNARIDAAEAEERRAAYWQPYRDRVSTLLDEMLSAGPVPALIAIHSFTPAWKGQPRPWHVGILWDADDRLARPTINALVADDKLIVGDNEPYDGALEGDTMYHHGSMRGLPHMLVEIRQDLVADTADEAAWAERLARILSPILADPELHAVKHFGTRTHPTCPPAG